LPLTIRWQNNNSDSSDFVFNNTVPPEAYTVTAFVYNSTDTSQITCKVTTDNPVTYYIVNGTLVYDDILNVSVTLTPVNNGNSFTSITGSNGNFTFNNVLPGTYNLSASSPNQFP